jgi:nucleoside-diphosphate-sugar epimerase
MSYWRGRRVTVTGGASFIGSHLTDRLLEAGARVRVADDLSSGSLANLSQALQDIEFLEVNLRDPQAAQMACGNQEIVFHLAADHGGRGYVDLHQAACATNLGLDQTVFASALQGRVGKLVFASSGCVYPNHLQRDTGSVLFLREDMVGPPYDPDGMYGLAKLAGELSLRAIHNDHGMGATSCRYFTVYGPRGVENHAVMAMIARAFLREDPFVVWGDGTQIRNWTYVDDIVAGTIAAAEAIDDGTAVNLGTMERIQVLDAVKLACDFAGYSPTLVFDQTMPTGPLNRVADNGLAHDLLNWRPAVPFVEGLHRTAEWYFATKDRDHVGAILPRLLTERPLNLGARDQQLR